MTTPLRFIEDDAAETLATPLDAQIGELCEFRREYGSYIQGCGVDRYLAAFGDQSAAVLLGRINPQRIRSGSALGDRPRTRRVAFRHRIRNGRFVWGGHGG
jgi:hypothetical protein